MQVLNSGPHCIGCMWWKVRYALWREVTSACFGVSSILPSAMLLLVLWQTHFPSCSPLFLGFFMLSPILPAESCLPSFALMLLPDFLPNSWAYRKLWNSRLTNCLLFTTVLFIDQLFFSIVEKSRSTSFDACVLQSCPSKNTLTRLSPCF